jgi:hypothetical protein
MKDLQSLKRKSVILFADILQDIFTTNPDVNPNFSKATENTVRNFQNQPL